MQATQKDKRISIPAGYTIVLFISLLAGLLTSTSLLGQTDSEGTDPAQAVVIETSLTTEEQPITRDEREKILATYEQHRREYREKREDITDEVEQELKNLTGKIKALNSDLKKGAAHLATVYQTKKQGSPAEISDDLLRLSEDKSKYERLLSALSMLNRASSFILSPLAFAAGTNGESVLFIFLPLTALNIFLYLFFRQRATFLRNKKLLITLLATIFLACATSLLAAPMDKRQEVISKLHFTADTLALTANQKAIAILESRNGQQIDLPPNLISGDEKLTIYTTVAANSPEYYVTLAALYSAEKDTEKAVESLRNIAEKNNLEEDPGEKIITSTVYFLVENGHPEIAGDMVINFADLITDTVVLSDLAEYLRVYSMQDSFSYTMKLLEQKTETTAGLLAIADSYYQAGGTEKSQSILERAFDAAKDTNDILLIAHACVRQQDDIMLKQLPERCMELAGDPNHAIALAKLYHEQQQYPLATAALKVAISKSTQLEQLKPVVQATVELKLEFLMDKIREKVILLSPGLQNGFKDDLFQQAYAQDLQFIDFLLSQKMPANGVKLFDELITRIKKEKIKDDQYISFMLHGAFDALERDMKKKAESIVFKLSMLIKPRTKSFSTSVTLPDGLLNSLQGLPDPDKVSIPLFNGLINEDIGQLSKAERVYMQAVIYSLDSVNSNLAEEPPETLNEFFLLGRLWQKENRINDLASLDHIYSFLEKQSLKNLTERRGEKLLTEPLARIAELKEKRDKQLTAIKAYDVHIAEEKVEYTSRQALMAEKMETTLAAEKKTVAALARKVTLKAGSTLLVQLVLLGLIIGCTVLAWQYSQQLKEHRTYGFFSKFLELNGWLRVFSIVGILSGFSLIIASQFLQIFQKVHELNLAGGPAEGSVRTSNGAVNLSSERNSDKNDQQEMRNEI
ncbi:MAG: hypothetical protein JRJ68_11265 [Deltaproteobacteria bacterium]|nr:hypothetical protein [Deltaproteobacteria bacterium]